MKSCTNWTTPIFTETPKFFNFPNISKATSCTFEAKMVQHETASGRKKGCGPGKFKINSIEVNYYSKYKNKHDHLSNQRLRVAQKG